MAFTYDVTTDRGKVRLLSTDTDADNAFFQDAEVDVFLALQSDNLKRAAAMALDTIASTEALVQKKVKLLNVETDGPSVARALREHAKTLRAEADAEDGGDGLFDIAEMVYDPFSARERRWNEYLRNG